MPGRDHHLRHLPQHPEGLSLPTVPLLPASVRFLPLLSVLQWGTASEAGADLSLEPFVSSTQARFLPGRKSSVELGIDTVYLRSVLMVMGFPNR